MKIQTGDMLIQDMGLKVGEVFQIGDGPRAFLMRYDGFRDGAGGRQWDKLSPVKKKPARNAKPDR